MNVTTAYDVTPVSDLRGNTWNYSSTDSGMDGPGNNVKMPVKNSTTLPVSFVIYIQTFPGEIAQALYADTANQWPKLANWKECDQNECFYYRHNEHFVRKYSYTAQDIMGWNTSSHLPCAYTEWKFLTLQPDGNYHLYYIDDGLMLIWVQANNISVIINFTDWWPERAWYIE